MKRILSVVVILTALAGAVPLVAQDNTVALLQQLTDTPGPPGFEEPIRKVLVDLMKLLSSSLTFDGLGLIIATQGIDRSARDGRRAHGRARRTDSAASRRADC